MLLHVYINYNLLYLFELVVMLFLDCSTVNGACCKKAKEKFWMSAMHFKCIEGQAFHHHETI